MNLSKDCLESPTISAIFRQKQGSNSVITELCICSSSNNADWMIGATSEFSMKYQQESAGLLRNQKCQMKNSGRSALEWKPPLSGRGRYESCKHIHFFTFTPPLSPPLSLPLGARSEKSKCCSHFRHSQAFRPFIEATDFSS